MTKVTMSTSVAANADMLWQAVGSFSAIGQWHPLVEVLKSDGDGKGSTRQLRLANGAVLQERLEEVSPGERLHRYSLLQGPLPIRDYVAEIRVKDNGDGTSTVEWSSDFTVTQGPEADIAKSIQDLYQAGLDNLKKIYGMKA